MAYPQELMFQNQLQFNLHVPLTTANIATHFRRPRPITVERIGGNKPAEHTHGFPIGTLQRKDSQNGLNVSTGSVQFSAVSEDKLAAAIQLAKRDLRNKKLQEKNRRLDGSRDRGRSSSPVAARQEKRVHGQKHWEMQAKRTRGRQAAGKKVLTWKPAGGKMKVKEHDRNQAPCNTSTQTPPATPPRLAFLSNKPAASARTNSPPTRDTPSLTKIVRVPQNDIEKLQMEMEMYLQQIESVERRALSEHNTDFLRQGQRSRSRDDRLEEEEREERRQLRMEEQATRAARNIYNLRQQVKQIEREVLTTPSDPKSTRKSQSATKLAAAHRGAVRALQAFVNQLPYQDLQGGLPSHYNELALLIRQLTLLSARIPQIENKGKEAGAVTSAVQDDLMAMLDRVENLNADWRRELQNRDPGPKPFKEKPPFVTNFKPSKEPFKVERVDRLQEQQKRQAEADRKAWLQAGVRALVDKLASVPNLQQKPRPKKQQKPPSLAMPTRKQPPTRKGLLLPATLKAKRQQAPRPTQLHWEPQTHFADPTITANLKASTLLHNPITEPRSSSAPSSPRARRKEVNFVLPEGGASHYHASYPGTQRGRGRNRSVSPQPRRSRSLSPHHSSSCSSSPSSPVRRRSPSPVQGRRRFFVQNVDEELVDELFPNGKQRGRQRQPSKQQDGSQRQILGSGDVSESFISEVERRVAERLRPVLQSKHTSQESLATSEEEDKERLMQMIVDDVMEETAQELTAMERSRAVQEKAAGMMDNPTVENIYQRLEEMEREALAIRQRWATISYHDTAPPRRHKPGARGFSSSLQPRDPPAFEITKLAPEAEEEPVKSFPEGVPDEPIVFTKDSKAFKPHVKFEELGDEAEETGARVPPPPKPQLRKSAVKPKVLLSMKQTVVERITDSVERFDYYQRGLKHHLGKRDPWRIVESVADQILDECFDQVASELEEINTAMADHIYTSEFMSETGLPLAPPELASDFVSGGTAAKNLRDSAAAQQSVQATVSEIQPFVAPSGAVTEAIGEVVEKAIGEPSSLMHVFDATELYEATAGEVTEDIQLERQESRLTMRDEDTRVEEDEYDEDFDEEDDDEYTDLTDEDETESNRS